MDQTKEWYRLDNAAKIIPSSVSGSDTRVFRIVCELKEDVDPVCLQQAVDEAARDFPYMNCCLRKGIFWYYLDELKETALVTKEHLPVLRAIYVPGRRNLLYRVSYYKKRMNLEMFHVLADGTGGFLFAQHIIEHYLILKHNLDGAKIKTSPPPISEMQTDAFSKYYEKDQARRRNYIKEMFPVKAYQLKGKKDPELAEHIVEGTVSTKQILDLAHGFHVTLGVLITSIWAEAIVRQMNKSEYNKPVVLSVPVNLRQFYPSETARNFFGVITVSYDPHDYDGTIESVIEKIAASFEDQLSKEQIAGTMNSYAALEHNYLLKFVPRFIKDWFVAGTAKRMNRGITGSVSNVGLVKLSDEFVPYIEKFCSFMSCKNIFMCISTFRDHMVFGIVSSYLEHRTEYYFFQRLRRLGIDVEIATNDYDKEDDDAM